MYGAKLNGKEIKDIFIEKGIIGKEETEEWEMESFFEYYNNGEDNIFRTCNLTLKHINEEEDIYIGRELSQMKKEETRAKFEKDVEDDIFKLLGKKVQCQSYQESWEPY